MKKLKVLNFGNSQPYPMYFTLKGKDGEHFQEQALDHSGQPLLREKKKVMDNFVAGTSEVTATHTEPLEVGDEIVINEVPHTIERIVESRQAKGHAIGIMWYNLLCSYVRFTGQTV